MSSLIIPSINPRRREKVTGNIAGHPERILFGLSFGGGLLGEMMDSRELLSEYAENGTESAFRDLVARYIDLVYSTALRQVGGDAHLAEDVAQTVFLHLARKARRIPCQVMLGGWLHQATCHVAATVVRSERRRKTREREAVEMSRLQNDPPSALEQIGPALDEVIGQLPEEDRAAVLLRFFEKRDFRSVGAAMGTSEDAARMRVNRALEKLQILLRQRGVTATAAVLGAALATNAVVAAPVGLATTLATKALAGASAGGAVAILKLMTLSKLKSCGVTAIAIGALTCVVVQHRAAARLRQENRYLREQIQASVAAKEQSANPTFDATTDANELANLRRNQSELLRLRAEVTALRNAQASARSAPAAPMGPGQPSQDASAPVARLQASVRAQVGIGQTLLTGGWTNEHGSRIFVLATPRIQGDNTDEVGIKTTIFEVPFDALSKFGLDTLKADGFQSSLQQVVPADQANLLLKQLKETDGARLIAQTSLLTLDGRPAQMQTMDQQLAGGENRGLAPTIDIIPVISADKSAIDMTLNAGLDRPSAP